MIRPEASTRYELSEPNLTTPSVKVKRLSSIHTAFHENLIHCWAGLVTETQALINSNIYRLVSGCSIIENGYNETVLWNRAPQEKYHKTFNY